MNYDSQKLVNALFLLLKTLKMGLFIIFLSVKYLRENDAVLVCMMIRIIEIPKYLYQLQIELLRGVQI